MLIFETSEPADASHLFYPKIEVDFTSASSLRAVEDTNAGSNGRALGRDLLDPDRVPLGLFASTGSAADGLAGMTINKPFIDSGGYNLDHQDVGNIDIIVNIDRLLTAAEHAALYNLQQTIAALTEAINALADDDEQ